MAKIDWEKNVKMRRISERIHQETTTNDSGNKQEDPYKWVIGAPDLFGYRPIYRHHDGQRIGVSSPDEKTTLLKRKPYIA